MDDIENDIINEAEKLNIHILRCNVRRCENLGDAILEARDLLREADSILRYKNIHVERLLTTVLSISERALKKLHDRALRFFDDFLPSRGNEFIGEYKRLKYGLNIQDLHDIERDFKHFVDIFGDGMSNYESISMAKNNMQRYVDKNNSRKKSRRSNRYYR